MTMLFALIANANATASNIPKAKYCDNTGNCGTINIDINTLNNNEANDGACVRPSSKPYSVCAGSFCQFCNLDKLAANEYLYLQCNYISDRMPKPQYFLMETSDAYLIGSGAQKLHGSYHLLMHDQFLDTAENHKNGFWPKTAVDKYTFQVKTDPMEPKATTGKLDTRNAYIIIGCYPVSKELSVTRPFLPVNN